MTDYYQILEIPKAATDAEIKKAYRKLALKYHPDKNQGDAAAEERFKKIAEAYSVLSDAAKKKQYDRPTDGDFNPFSFDSFVNQFGSDQFRNNRSRDNTRGKASQHKTHQPPPDPTYLNIYLKAKISLAEAVSGKKVELSFSKKKIKYTGLNGDLINFVKEDEEKEITIQVNLTSVFLQIVKEDGRHIAKVRVNKLGNDDVVTRQNLWGGIEQHPMFGDLYVEIEIDFPENVELEGNNIVHQVSIPLYKIVNKGEKIRIETILGKKYDAEINQPDTLTDLKFILSSEGILDEQSHRGNYIIKFDILAPNLSNLDKEEKSIFLAMLQKT